MMKWRVVFTDSESLSGVAPVCDQPDLHVMEYGEGPDSFSVYDCCPHPHLQTCNENDAKRLASILNDLDAGVCT